MDRRRFLQMLPAAVGGAALVELSACVAPRAVDGGASDAGVVMLPFAAHPELVTVGGGVVLTTGPMVVVRTAVDAAVALSGLCTHEYCPLGYLQGSLRLSCDCHGALFDLGGGVLRGPARLPLGSYRATVGADGITVEI